MALALSLAVLGLLLAVLALLLAIRTERHLRRLATALAHEWGLRTGADRDAVAPTAEQGALSEAQAQLRRSIEALEQRMFELAAHAAAPSPPAAVLAPGVLAPGVLAPGVLAPRGLAPGVQAPRVHAPGMSALAMRATGTGSAPAAPAGQREPDSRERVRRHLEELGYEEVVVLPGRGTSGFLIYEAREDGMPRKGAAQVGEDGRVTLSPARALRVFP